MSDEASAVATAADAAVTGSNGRRYEDHNFDAKARFPSYCEFVQCEFGQKSVFGNGCIFTRCSFAFERSFMSINNEANFIFGDGCVFKDSQIGAGSSIGSNCEFSGTCQVAPGCSIGKVKIEEAQRITFGPGCQFLGDSQFGSRLEFGTGCQFFGKATFGDSNQFGVNCKFHDCVGFGIRNTFNINCLFYKRSLFGDKNQFNMSCEFDGKKSQFGDSCTFGMRCSFADSTRFGSNCDWGMGCSVGHYCMAMEEFGDIDSTLASQIKLVKRKEEREGQSEASVSYHNSSTHEQSHEIGHTSLFNMGSHGHGEITTTTHVEKGKEKEKENETEKEKEKEKAVLEEKEASSNVLKEKGKANKEGKNGWNGKDIKDMIAGKIIYGGSMLQIVPSPDLKGAIVVSRSTVVGVNIVAPPELALKPGILIVGQPGLGYYSSFDQICEQLHEIQVHGCHSATFLTIMNNASKFPFESLAEYKQYIEKYMIGVNATEQFKQDLGRAKSGVLLANNLELERLQYFEQILKFAQMPIEKSQLDAITFRDFSIPIQHLQVGARGARQQNGQYGAMRAGVENKPLQSYRFDGIKN